MSSRWLTVLVATALAASATACADRQDQQPAEGVGVGAEWTAVGGGMDEAGYSQLDEINTDNAGQLGLAWSLDLPGEVSLEATPIMVDGTLYFTGSEARVYAVDAATGRIKWQYDPKTWKYRPDALKVMYGVNRGVGYEDGKIFVAARDCRLFALDAESGKVLWQRLTIPRTEGKVCIGAPRVMNGKVIIGNAGAEQGARGFVTAFSSRTGRQLWRFLTIPNERARLRGSEAMQRAAESWSEDGLEAASGGTVSNGITLDPDLNRVYIGTGKSWPQDPEMRDPGGGDNLYTASIVALDADSGEYLWHYQQNPREAWGYGSTANIVTARLRLDGEERDVLMHAPTNGFFYLLDRKTGEFISAGPTTEITWARSIDPETGKPVENPDIRYEQRSIEIWPGKVGGHDRQAMAYNPKLGLVYIPVQQLGARFTRVEPPEVDPPNDPESVAEPAENPETERAKEPKKQELLVEIVSRKPGDGHGYLVAWDPVAQKAAWRIKHPHLWNGGALTTAGKLVFQGTAGGWFNAYDGRTGERLWRFNAGLGIIGAPMTYMVDGEQYVSILVGYGGPTSTLGEHADVGWKYGAQKRRLLTFALGADGELPEGTPPSLEVAALDDPDLVIDETDIEPGRAVYARCAACHGLDLHATGAPGPDLRETPVALDLEEFATLLKEAPLLERGMPRYEDLSDDEIRQLHAYIRSSAREVLRKRAENVRPAPFPEASGSQM